MVPNRKNIAFRGGADLCGPSRLMSFPRDGNGPAMQSSDFSRLWTLAGLNGTMKDVNGIAIEGRHAQM
jgi:hypothetical protein